MCKSLLQPDTVIREKLRKITCILVTLSEVEMHYS